MSASPAVRLHALVFRLVGLLLGLALWAPPAGAQTDAAGDAAIRERLTRIYEASEEWERIDVSVTGGVVTLEGEVLRAESAETAATIAERVDGVVYVDDRLEAARDLERSLTSALERLRERFYELLGFVPLLAVAVALFALFYLLSGRIAKRVQASRRISENAFVRDIAMQLVRLVVILVGLLLALDLLDATAVVGAVLGTAGIVGLAVGFAFRDLVENYISSILLSLRHPFAPNDHVVVDGKEGRIIRLTSRATILLTLDGNHLRIPNATVFKAAILNYTRNPRRRFEFDVGAGSNEDLPLALALGVETLLGLDGVLPEPKPFGIAESLGDSTVNLRFHGWVEQSSHDFAKVRSAAILSVKKALDDAGIDMPEPIYRVRSIDVTQSSEDDAGQARGSVTEIDISLENDLERTIEEERASGDEDLLSAEAPLE